MKKILLGMMAASMMFATSCQNEEFADGGNLSTVSFNVGTPEIASRAYSDGSTATHLQYAVYDAAGNVLSDLTVTDATINGGSTTVNLQLTTGNTYSVIFWAAAPNAPYTVDFAAKTMTVDYTAAKTVSNDENRDAFYKYHTFTVTGAQTETIELKRPFAQLNIGVGDYVASTKAGYTPTKSAVTVKNIYNKLNLWNGTVDGSQEVTYDYAAIPTNETFPVAGYEYLSMNYLLVATEKALVEVEFGYTETDAAAAKTRTVGSVPVQRNYRTNIYGNLLTSDVDINVTIKPEYDGEYNNEGYFIEESTNGAVTAIVESANGLATIANAIAEGTIPSDANIALDGDIDLAELTLARSAEASNWTPIGTSANPFEGTFDGKGYTIKNMVINGGSNSDIGFFGVTHNGEIKNINFENAKVSGRFNVGVVAGTPYTSKYTNITVTGHVEVDGMAYVGTVGGKNAYANWTNITVNVDKTSYVNANSVEDGKAYRTYVGGVVGFNGEGGHSFTNITSNINVKGSTCDVGGLFGIAHYGNKFENCVCTGNVEIYNAAEEADAQEIGGIAGVWHPGGEDVVMKNCSFTGTLTANNNFVIDTYKFGNLVCAAYNTTGSGKLIVDGFTYGANETSKTPVATAEQLVAALAAGKDVIFLNDITVAASEGGYNKAGILQNKAQTIDGGGHTLTVTDAGATWDCAIYTNGGIIKNITVAGAMRGIFTAGLSSDLKIDNVEFKNVIYTFNSDGDMPANPFGVYVSNSTVNGWTSHSNMHTEVVYTNCSFGEGSGYKYCRPYGKTEFVNCTFCAGFTVDQSMTSYITFTGCTWEK